MSLNSVFLVRLRVGFVNTPPKTNWNGPLMEWSRGNLGARNDSCRGGIFESARISSKSCELSSDELRSRGMGRARALDEEAAINEYEGPPKEEQVEEKFCTPTENDNIASPSWSKMMWKKNLKVPRWSSDSRLYMFQGKNRIDLPINGSRVPLPI